MPSATNGASTIEAVVRGVNLVEEDPDDSSVGYGGLPNADGVVQRMEEDPTVRGHFNVTRVKWRRVRVPG